MKTQTNLNDLAAAYDAASLAYDRNPTEVNRAAKVAAAWSYELRRVFGKRAGDARYDARGTSTTELRHLCDAKLAADRVCEAAS